jgi:hypothetical protein
VSKSLQGNNTRTTFNRFPTKTAILWTSHIIRKLLQAKTWSLSGGVHHWLKRRSTREEKKPVTRNYNNNGYLEGKRRIKYLDLRRIKWMSCLEHYARTEQGTGRFIELIFFRIKEFGKLRWASME